MAQPYKKRRHAPSPNKNELKISRTESAENSRVTAGTLRERFPRVRRLRLETRMETPSGAILDQADRWIAPDERLFLDVPCQGGCSNGLFLLTEVVSALLSSDSETRDGMGLCQAVSYQD